MSNIYENAVCLAPMVRAGTLPLRLLSLRNGADLVYGEEIIDKKIAHTHRTVNEVLDTIDFVSSSGDSVVFRTCAEEKSKVVFQIGTAASVTALKAAEMVANDVASVDINMGCPKHFSIQGGMGIALMSKPEVASDIIKTLKRNLNIPVSCKIRIKETPSETVSYQIDFAKGMEQAGAAAIGIHCRQAHERPCDDAHWDALKTIPSALSVPVLANGDIYTQEDIARVRAETGCQSVLIARGALQNASCFRKEGLLPYTENICDFLRVAAETDNVYQNTKYSVSRMLPSKVNTLEAPSVVVPYGDVTVADIAATKSNREMFALFGLDDVVDTYTAKYAARAAELQVARAADNPDRTYDDSHVLNRQFYCDACSLQLLSDQDVALHIKGKRHKKKLRAVASKSLLNTVESANKRAKLDHDADVDAQD
ncbi:tRNA-dihydrouridine synthase [Achlya hypogyna]|uniref:tRNA-dihydrouridine synthase n=1 Tax=Achlya hypogyna TaxID=1202772 RepID=A0A1V9ZGX1_ACHHY|nr:tRNA-dihydrouridine synthase [Achlya hypogyna]